MIWLTATRTPYSRPSALGKQEEAIMRMLFPTKHGKPERKA